jgi:hypothetical protein
MEKKQLVNAVIAVNNKGIIAVSWYDNRNTTQSGCWDVQVAFSTDGGETFSQPISISNTFCTSHKTQPVKGSERWKYGGDYYGIGADKNGSFHLAWCDSRTGVYQLFYTTISP